MKKILLILMTMFISCGNEKQTLYDTMPSSQKQFFETIEDYGTKLQIENNELTVGEMATNYHSYINSTMASDWVGRVDGVHLGASDYFTEVCFLAKEVEEIIKYRPSNQAGFRGLRIALHINSIDVAKKLKVGEQIIFSGQLKEYSNDIVIENAAFKTENGIVNEKFSRINDTRNGEVKSNTPASFKCQWCGKTFTGANYNGYALGKETSYEKEEREVQGHICYFCSQKCYMMWVGTNGTN